MLDTPSSLITDVRILKEFHASPAYVYDSYLRLQSVEVQQQQKCCHLRCEAMKSARHI